MFTLGASALCCALLAQDPGLPRAPELQADEERAEEFRRHDLSSATHGPATELLSEWSSGLRRWREAAQRSGYAFEAYVTLDSSAHLAGGADPHSSATRGLLDAVLTIDTARAFGLAGGKLVLGLQALGGADGSAEVGVVQSTSNIDAGEDRVQLARFWYQQDWRGGATRLRLGKMDANSQFASVLGAGHFIHSSMGFSPTILGFPSYPDSAFGLSARQRLAGGVELRAGVFDGAAQEGVRTGERGPGTFFGSPSDLFLIAQAGAEWASEQPAAGRLALGYWEHTGDFARFDGGSEDGTGGLYAVLEQRLQARGRAFDAFLQLGEADEEVAAISRHVGLGLATSALFLPEREDALGIGMSLARLSDEPGAGFSEDAEAAFELFYGLRLYPGVRLKPDLQYVHDPGGDSALDDAWILTLRISASL